MLNRLSPKHGAQRPPKRVGRGPGSGAGKTCGRGAKGQGKRSAGRPTSASFEGGQMPLVRRLPKRGFTNIHRVPVDAVNLRDLARFGDGATVDVSALASSGVVGARARKVKVLAEGDAPKNLTLRVHRISAAARAKVEAAGGSVELLT